MGRILDNWSIFHDFSASLLRHATLPLYFMKHFIFSLKALQAHHDSLRFFLMANLIRYFSRFFSSRLCPGDTRFKQLPPYFVLLLFTKNAAISTQSEVAFQSEVYDTYLASAASPHLGLHHRLVIELISGRMPVVRRKAAKYAILPGLSWFP